MCLSGEVSLTLQPRKRKEASKTLNMLKPLPRHVTARELGEAVRKNNCGSSQCHFKSLKKFEDVKEALLI